MKKNIGVGLSVMMSVSAAVSTVANSEIDLKKSVGDDKKEKDSESLEKPKDDNIIINENFETPEYPYYYVDLPEKENDFDENKIFRSEKTNEEKKAYDEYAVFSVEKNKKKVFSEKKESEQENKIEQEVFVESVVRYHNNIISDDVASGASLSTDDYENTENQMDIIVGNYKKCSVSDGNIEILTYSEKDKTYGVYQNDVLIAVLSPKSSIELFGSTNVNNVCIGDNIEINVILNDVSVSVRPDDNLSAEKFAFSAGENSEVTFKIANDRENTFSSVYSSGKIIVEGETGLFSCGNIEADFIVNGGVITVSGKIKNESDNKIIVNGGSVNINENMPVFNSKGEKVYMNKITLEDCIGSQPVEVNFDESSFVSKTDFGGSLYVYAPDKTKNVVINCLGAKYYAELGTNFSADVIAVKMSDAQSAECEVFHYFDKNGINAEFRIKLDSENKSDKIGVQFFEDGWVVGSETSEKNMYYAEFIQEESCYKVVISGIKPYVNYSYRIFSQNTQSDIIQFGDVNLFTVNESSESGNGGNGGNGGNESNESESNEKISVSGLVKTYNGQPQTFDIDTSVSVKILYMINGEYTESMPVDAGVYPSRIIVDDEEFQNKTFDFDFVINKADLTVVSTPTLEVVRNDTLLKYEPVGGEIYCGENLSDGKYEWTDGGIVVENGGMYEAIFTPYNQNYSPVSVLVSVIIVEPPKINFSINLKESYFQKEGSLFLLKVDTISDDETEVLYQWYKDGELIDGQTMSILVIDDAKESDSGDYFVEAKSVGGLTARSNVCSVKIGDFENTSLYEHGISTAQKEDFSALGAQKEKNDDNDSEENLTDENKNENKNNYINKIFGVSSPKGRHGEEESDVNESFETSTEDYTEETSQDISEDYMQNGDDYGEYGSLYKRITDDMIVPLYGKAETDGWTKIDITFEYPLDLSKGKPVVYQMNEIGCFLPVKEFNYSSGTITVNTKRDFPVIVGYDSGKFYDVSGHWDDEDIKFVTSLGFMTERSGAFSPDSNISRVDVITALYKLSGSPEPLYELPHTFADIPTGSVQYDAVQWAYENNLVNGVSDFEFAPQKPLTREQMAVVISKYIDGLGFDSFGGEFWYVDSATISDWATEAVNHISNCGIMRGMGYNRFQPKVLCTRAEYATILKKLIQFKVDM